MNSEVNFNKTFSENEIESLVFLKKALSIYSPSGEEERITPLYINFLKSNGWRVQSSNLGNVIGIKGSGRPILLLASHIDTISPHIPFSEDEEYFYGRGAVDCKPSWVSMLYSAGKFNWDDLFRSNNGNGTVILLGVVKEENDICGLTNFFENNKLKPDLAVFGEPTKINRICYGYRGRIWIQVEISGQSGHASSCWNYLNPIELTMEFWNRLKELGQTFRKPLCEDDLNTNHFNELTLALTTINAGEHSNVIPKICNSDIDIRVPPELKVSDIIAKVEEIKKELEIEYNTSIKCNYPSKIDAAITDPNSILINALRWAIFNTLKKRARLLKKTGTTFMNLIKNQYNIPTIVYGPGDPRLEHTSDERISKKEFIYACRIYMKFFPKLFELWRKKKDKQL